MTLTFWNNTWNYTVAKKKVLKLVLLIVVFIWHGDIFDLKLGVPEIAQEKMTEYSGVNNAQTSQDKCYILNWLSYLSPLSYKQTNKQM